MRRISAAAAMPFLQRMQELGERSGARVEWPGKIFDPAELAEEYRSSLVFVYPSVAETGEALPVAPLEAMAHGCAPIVSNLPCFRDYIADGVTGFVFDQRGTGAGKKPGRFVSRICSDAAGRRSCAWVKERGRRRRNLP